MKKLFLIILSVFLLTGCMQSSEHLTLNEDGTGTLQVDTSLPRGTIELMDMMMASMMQAMQQAFTPEGETADLPEQPSVEDTILTKEELLKKAREKGLEIELQDFNRTVNEEGIRAQYAVTFNDINDLTESGLMSTNVKFEKDANDNWVCEPIQDKQKAVQAEGQMQQFEDFKSSDEFNNLNPVMQTMILNAMGDLKFEFLVSMPFPILEASGAFEKIDERSAKLAIAGNILEDEELIKQMSGLLVENTRVVWNSSGKGLPDTPVKPVSEIKPPMPTATNVQNLSGEIQIHLKDGSVKTGEFIEETDDYVKILFSEIPVTYYKDEIERVE